ncbi:MAG: phenylalanine--tRNA ligase subunit beta [Parcubacteria group bacterium CG23_combo_of_CG06-09_8_20_14_all_35_9]|nr:MAG: phenylalanine--tRNA ligase subunit beta [Parcubacteria group bacterium CG23_combo_of_CG06-09_8_20_14_all_35_9]
MRISLNWLKDFVNISETISPEELKLCLTMTTTEVESLEKIGGGLQNVIVGEVIKIKKHPNAEKLFIGKVNIGKRVIQVVFAGKVRVKVGDKIATAVAPAHLPTGIKVEKKNVRGVASEGMLCLDSELFLEAGEALTSFSSGTKIGISINKVLPIEDVIYEIDNKSITHRPDLWGHYGLSREIAAILGKKFREYKVNKVNKKVNKVNKVNKVELKIDIRDKKLCPRYLGVVVDNVKIAPSPLWLRRRLESVGVRAINNIVDITNYVMLELGQPLHAFDAEKLKTPKIIVRRAKEGEIFSTLDGEERDLTDEMLVIADKEKPVALAGIMGGINSEISEGTKRIVIESANFDPISIRKTSGALGLRTEASQRFEKALDPNLAEWGIKKAIELIQKLIPEAKVVSPIVDKKYFKLDQGPIKLSLEYLNKKIGIVIPPSRVMKILKSLGFGVHPHTIPDKLGSRGTGKTFSHILVVKVPSWRATRDVNIPDDLVEEVARIYGYDNINPQMPKVEMERLPFDKEHSLERIIKNILAYRINLTEVYNYSFVNEKLLLKFGIDSKNHIGILNPLNENQSLLRQSLIPNLILNTKLNLRHFNEFGIFEIGRVFLNRKGKYKENPKTQEPLPLEKKKISGVIIQEKNKIPFYKTEEVVLSLLEGLDIECEITSLKDGPVWIHPSRSAEINPCTENFVVGVKSEEKRIGIIGELHPVVAGRFGIKERVGIFDLDFDIILSLYKETKAYKPIIKYPKIVRDLAIVLDKKILWQEVKNAVLETNKELIREIELFDIYEGTEIEKGKKNLAFHITFQAKDRTLKEKEIEKIQEKILSLLQEKFGAKIRS